MKRNEQILVYLLIFITALLGFTIQRWPVFISIGLAVVEIVLIVKIRAMNKKR